MRKVSPSTLLFGFGGGSGRFRPHVSTISGSGPNPGCKCPEPCLIRLSSAGHRSFHPSKRPRSVPTSSEKFGGIVPHHFGWVWGSVKAVLMHMNDGFRLEPGGRSKTNPGLQAQAAATRAPPAPRAPTGRVPPSRAVLAAAMVRRPYPKATREVGLHLWAVASSYVWRRPQLCKPVPRASSPCPATTWVLLLPLAG